MDLKPRDVYGLPSNKKHAWHGASLYPCYSPMLNKDEMIIVLYWVLLEGTLHKSHYVSVTINTNMMWFQHHEI